MSPEPHRQNELIDRLANARDRRARERLLRRHEELRTAEVVEQLYNRVVQVARIDLKRADGLVHAATWIAEALGDDGCRAQSLRAAGHMQVVRGKYREALEYYDRALTLFRQLERDVDVGRTLNGALVSFISVGRYDEALASAQEARGIFERHGNRLGLARLDSNAETSATGRTASTKRSRFIAAPTSSSRSWASRKTSRRRWATWR
jgi:tetratricopeptide (TPR) repeat protein